MQYAVYALVFVLLFDMAFVAIMHRHGVMKERRHSQRSSADWLRISADKLNTQKRRSM